MDKSFKENLKNYYNQDAARRNRNKRRAHWKIKVRKNFYTVIKRENKKTLLELGAGAGFDSLFFQKKDSASQLLIYLPKTYGIAAKKGLRLTN